MNLDLRPDRGADVESGRTVAIGTTERDWLADPTSGMGLWVQEALELLEHIQTGILDEPADRFVRAAAHCLACSKSLGIKDTKSVVYRTTFGQISVRSPRFYNCCNQSGFQSGDGGTVSPLTKALRERVHRQWA